MKHSALLAAAASVVTATSSVALSAAADSSVSNSDKGVLGRTVGSGSRRRQKNDGFAPRFDGLRFIESLVTAHR